MSTEYAIELGKRLRIAREIAGLSQGQVGKKLGMTGSMVSALERGQRKVKAELLLEFAELYCVKFSWLGDGNLDDADISPELKTFLQQASEMPEEDKEKLLFFIQVIAPKKQVETP